MRRGWGCPVTGHHYDNIFKKGQKSYTERKGGESRACETVAWGYFLKELWPAESPHRSEFLSGSAAHGEPPVEQILPEGRQPMERKHAGAGKQRDEERAAERNCYGLTIIPHPHAPLSMG